MTKEFNYNYADTVKNADINVKFPHQVELQPGRGCGFYKCPYCYGINQANNSDAELTLEQYEQLFSDIKGKVPLVTIAGIRTESLTSRHISGIFKSINKNGLDLGLNTKGYLFTDEIINSMMTGIKEGSFITFSLDSAINEYYDKIHGINAGTNSLNKVYENMKKVFEIKKQNNLNIFITGSCLLFDGNSSFEDMEKFVTKFGPYSTRIRFSFPQTPNFSNDIPAYYVAHKEDVENNIIKLREKYPEYKIHFLKFNTDNHATEFKYCYAQRFLFAIDYCGNVYPCPQVTVKEYKPLVIGNLHRNTFDEILNSDIRKKLFDTPIDDMKCRVCDRKDEEINTYLNIKHSDYHK
ncbi:MAG: radical SAM protein [Candidatus Woesearchaeota archaeon]